MGNLPPVWRSLHPTAHEACIGFLYGSTFWFGCSKTTSLQIVHGRRISVCKAQRQTSLKSLFVIPLPKAFFSSYRYIRNWTNQVGCPVDHKGALAEKKDNPMKFFFFLKWEITRQGGTWGWHRRRRHHCCQCSEGRSVKLWSLRGYSRWPTRSLIQMLQDTDPHIWAQIRHLRQCSLPTSTESSLQESESILEPAWVQWILGRKLLPGSNLTPTAPDVRWKVLARKRAPYERKIRLWKLRNLWKLLWSFSWCEHVTPCWQAHNDGRLIWEIWQTWRNAVFQQNSAASCELLAPGSGNSPSLDFLPSHSSSHMWPLTCVHSFNPTCQLDSAIWSEPVRGLEHCSMSNCLLSILCHCILSLFPVWEAEFSVFGQNYLICDPPIITTQWLSPAVGSFAVLQEIAETSNSLQRSLSVLK